MWHLQGNVGARLKESVAINSSLMTLGRCLEALRWNQQHRQQEPRLVPYRESKARCSSPWSPQSTRLRRYLLGPMSMHYMSPLQAQYMAGQSRHACNLLACEQDVQRALLAHHRDRSDAISTTSANAWAFPAQVTHLFRDVLHGWGQILLAVCASPAARDYDETARVLRYASLATQIGTAARAQPPLRVLRCA